jgi:hypothetical protein
MPMNTEKRRKRRVLSLLEKFGEEERKKGMEARE